VNGSEKPSLAGCWVKIARAREHNYRLEQVAEAFLKRRPNQISFDDYSEPEWIIVRAVSEPIPVEFSAIAGDLIQNLRSALDLLVWQVVLTEGGAPGRHNAFPLMTSPSEFERRVRNPPKDKKGPLDGIDPTGEKWAIIERSQPYKPAMDLVAQLATFSNRDKHQGLLTSVSFTHNIDPDELLDVLRDPNPEIVLTFKPPDALEHGAEILRVQARPGAGVEMKADPPFEITVSDGNDAMAISALDRLRSEVVGIIRAFEKFF
jgi:hypothetical protein